MLDINTVFYLSADLVTVMSSGNANANLNPCFSGS